jgi:hypothetical protein
MLSLTLEKTNSLVLIFDLGIQTFFGLGDPGVFPLCRPILCFRVVLKKPSFIACDHSLISHGSVHRNINLIEITNKMRLCSRFYHIISYHIRISMH